MFGQRLLLKSERLGQQAVVAGGDGGGAVGKLGVGVDIGEAGQRHLEGVGSEFKAATLQPQVLEGEGSLREGGSRGVGDAGVLPERLAHMVVAAE